MRDCRLLRMISDSVDNRFFAKRSHTIPVLGSESPSVEKESSAGLWLSNGKVPVGSFKWQQRNGETAAAMKRNAKQHKRLQSPTHNFGVGKSSLIHTLSLSRTLTLTLD